ncbi:MAG: DUF4062 domain-containing protein [Bacteroidetes bacterium]|nr:DUF4062 domain-containing protein [Bacteroidota bacterium]
MRSSEFRVFLSSTFRDLQPEREQLVKKVFPRIRAVCRERGVEFTEIDLRWGITAEESRSGKAVRICLDEIGKCAPYFIGILGSRYGWAPGLDELQKDGECLERYPWLEELGREHKSITEMEITHGALHRDTTDSAFFYEQVSRLDDIPDYEREKFDSLKHRIRERGFACRMFASPEELGEHVYRDLLALLDRDYPIEQELTPVELERAPHLAYSVNRRRSYVANPEYLRRFEAHVDSDDIPLILWGRSGLGKSALVAYLTHEYKKQHPDAFVISHFIGAAAAGSDPEDVMRQVMMEIKERYALDDEIPQDDQKIREEFPAWLAKVQNEKLILAIDALNQLTGVAEELHWLPEFIPSHVRLVVSTTPGHTLEQLRKHQWQELELQPLDVPTRERIANEYLLQYNKKLTPEQLAFIANDPKCESPLFLRTLIEELRVFGRHTTLDEHIASYLASRDERELFAHILARMEDDFGEATVRSVMQTIYASRYGLSQTELYGITKLSQLALSEFLIALEYHLMQRSGLYTFFHNYLREAVEARYLSTEEDLRSAHRTIAEYWTTQPYTTRRRDEEPWQWQQVGDMTRLRDCLLAPGMVAMLDTDHERYEAFGFWRTLGGVEIEPGYGRTLLNSGLSAKRMVEAFLNTIDLLVLADEHHKAEALFNAGRHEFESLGIVEEQRLWLREREILILNHLGRTDEVIARTEAMLADEKAMSVHPTLRIELLDNLSHAYSRVDNFAEAERIIRISIDESKEIYGNYSPKLFPRLNSLASNLTFQGQFEEAEKYLSELVHGTIEQTGYEHPSVAYQLMQLASCRTLAGRLDGVIEDLEIAESIFIKTLGKEHFYTCNCGLRLAEAKRLLNDFVGACSILTDIMEIMERKYPRHLETAVWGIALGFNYYLMGDYASAIPYYEKFLPRLVELLGVDNPEVVRRRDRLAEMKEKLSQVSPKIR